METSSSKGAASAAGKRKRTTAASSSSGSPVPELSSKDLPSPSASTSTLLSTPAAAASTTPSHAILSAISNGNLLSHSTIVLPPTAISPFAASPSATTPISSTTTTVLPKPSLSTKNVPAFLTKLYSMVSDVSSDELIHWSDDGSAFIVHRHEDFARDVLPKFFKHNNFSSFVRQLNMYGFHKIPHIQQGALVTDGEPEMWEFANPHFQRNQPDLLCLVTRKKSKEDGEKESLDLSTVLHEIAAIKRHQFSISSDLKSIQKENQALWTETVGLRDRYLRQQHTIDRIVRFLASVVAAERPQITKKRRLLLEDSVPTTVKSKGDGVGTDLELFGAHEELDSVHQRMLDLIQPTPKLGSANITAASPTPPPFLPATTPVPTTSTLAHPLSWIDSEPIPSDPLVAGLHGVTRKLDDTAAAAASIADNIDMLDIHLNAAEDILGLDVHDFFDVEGASGVGTTPVSGMPGLSNGIGTGLDHEAIMSLVGGAANGKNGNGVPKVGGAGAGGVAGGLDGKDDLASILLGDEAWKRAGVEQTQQQGLGLGNRDGFGIKLEDDEEEGQEGVGSASGLLPADTDLDPEFDLLLGGALG
ncbi:stress-responsive transcription factor hsf1 [Phlyctochytrium planicorne]|nr:stress-responsive transcription factor hsf1 [Phlyctochytrium planicorne]